MPARVAQVATPYKAKPMVIKQAIFTSSAQRTSNINPRCMMHTWCICDAYNVTPIGTTKARTSWSLRRPQARLNGRHQSARLNAWQPPPACTGSSTPKQVCGWAVCLLFYHLVSVHLVCVPHTLGSTRCIDSGFASLFLVTAHVVFILLGVRVASYTAFAKIDAMF